MNNLCQIKPIFSTRIFGLRQTINISQLTCRHVPKHKIFPQEKLPNCGRRAKEILINTPFVKERVFTVEKNDLCQIDLEISVFRCESRSALDDKHFENNLAT